MKKGRSIYLTDNQIGIITVAIQEHLEGTYHYKDDDCEEVKAIYKLLNKLYN
jgi:hypothetical protein